ncbi:interactor protein for cytohesin exchange factors 1 [Microcaecilia unicolor]|uniref:Interactor protein for cytohesin exchange factors 1 n=1 Tax=Microcaecilia unicolor TaxID=1415580 RepID=A0A6P7XIZ4_9AMPH|nr:interactor protein for cytohesin exchange factors 1 [Microcaecilia unicolor]XP_030052423.1 interactor protein for cytohesin exchange factors 1 [Microcaecilia unicolor]XP_030052424.1 interactor protein for cytohesin exchange factors 1 [Microcaecilia unicolor]XP_030052425.1 interactor protein for cytohesin exchange factors 1 [Microcaecilia unicolor]
MVPWPPSPTTDIRVLFNFPSSTSLMAADGGDAVSLRQKPNKKSRGNIFTMSRRRISCKDLGQADCQGWLYKKKEKGAFLSNKWKKFWSVLKGSCLYWYTSQMSEKAEGFINLPDFTVDRATECKKKHALKISHPQIKAFYFAAENAEEMNKWLNKLGLAVIQRPCLGKKNEEECWSESEQDDSEVTVEMPPPPYTAERDLHQTTLQPSSSSPALSSGASCSFSSSSEGSMQSKGSSVSLSKMVFQERQSWLDIVNSSSAPEEMGQPLSFSVQLHTGHSEQDNDRKTASGSEDSVLREDTASRTTRRDHLSVPAVQATLGKEQTKNSQDDEMEKLYKSLEQASLSPIGDRRPSTKKELRKSFIKRSKNPSVNEKLHKIRALNSTLKCKEHDLALINQLLEDHELTAKKYREWKDTNTMLFQDIYQQPAPQDSSETNVSVLAMLTTPEALCSK